MGADGNDLIFGGDGKDIIDGALGNDTTYGVADNDLVFGYIGDGQVYGGDDLVNGGAGNDRVFGGKVGLSIFFEPNLGKGEVNTLIGNAGNDTFVLGAILADGRKGNKQWPYSYNPSTPH